MHKINIPAADPGNESSLQAFADFVQIVRRLRKECPWDREQTHESVRHLLIEEAYETVSAIDSGDLPELKKELGDLFLHVLFHAVIAEENDSFTLTEIIETESRKLIRRHPHIYGDVSVDGAEEVLKNWEQIKQTEKGRGGALDGVPDALPALLQAHRIQEKAAGVGFDFPDGDSAWEKVEEELAEFKHACESDMSQDQKEREFGDLLFSLVNFARFYDIVPENALRGTTQKFKKRFGYIESALTDQGLALSQVTLDDMDVLWEKAKTLEKGDQA